MVAPDSLKRLGGGRWETRDGRFAIEPQSGTWVIVDNEQTDELGLPLVRGPFGSLTAAKEAIDAARSEGPKASPLAERLKEARRSEAPAAMAPKAESGSGSAGRVEAAGALTTATGKRGGGRPASPAFGRSVPAPVPPAPAAPEPSPTPRWLRDLDAADQRRARDLIARLERSGVSDPERVVRSEVVDGEAALARVAIERAVSKAVRGSTGTSGAVRAAVRAILRGADVELGVGWHLVDDDGRRIEKVDLPD